MPRLSIQCLPKAERNYRRGTKASIETPALAREEDSLRAKRLSWPSVVSSNLIDIDQALDLADALQPAGQGEGAPKTLASASYVRIQRLKLFSSLWQFVEQCPLAATTFTLVAGRWQLPADDLKDFDPRKLLNAVRSDLARSGPGKAHGGIFMAVDGELEPNRQLYQPHVHGLVVGKEMIRSIDSLRNRSKYRPVEGTAQTAAVKRPVSIRRKPLERLPDPLTYLLKLYWPCRWAPIGNEGSGGKERRKRRLPEPYHSQWLLWMDQWALSDITLMMGMYVGANGFELSGSEPAQ